MSLKIATRRSKLALVQTDLVISMVKQAYGVSCDILLIETEGDRKLDVALDKIGGKGLFVKDIEISLIDGRSQAAVHSMKDVPYELAEVFEIAAMPVREDSRDAFISRDGTSFFYLPKGAKVGTSSSRRIAQIRALRSDLQTVPIRGNIESRLSKMETEGLDGIILAAAGLKRLNLESSITNYFDPHEFVPAVGQGALGVEILKASDSGYMFKGIDNEEVRVCIEGERNFMKKLNGGCHSCLGAYATLQGEIMNIIGVFEVSGKLVKKDITGDKWDYINLGEKLAGKIIEA